MKKVLLAFSIILCLFITCTFPFNTEKEKPHLLNSSNVKTGRGLCFKQDTVVTVIDITSGEKISGVTIYKENENFYVATSYSIYNSKHIYEIVFNDYNRYRATIVGSSKEDEIFILKCVAKERSYCIANTTGNLKSYTGEKVSIYGKYNYDTTTLDTYINNVGVCKNCGEETYKNYFYSRLTIQIDDSYLGAGIYNLNDQLVGIVTNYLNDYKWGVSFVDSNRVLDMLTKYIQEGKYDKNYIKYNLLDVSELTEKEKYLYSISEDINVGVLVTSLHYINYFTFGLNQGMVILQVNDVSVKNIFDFDYEISKYEKGSYLDLKVKTIVGLYRTIKVKI